MEPRREHLRALLDRARLARASAAAAVKREPPELKAETAPALLPTPGPALAHGFPPPFAPVDDRYEAHGDAPAPAGWPAPCSCSHVHGGHVDQRYPSDYTTQWHYEAHPPPSVVIPTAYATPDLAAIDHALRAHAATASPSMSTATSSSSSRNGIQRAQPPSPSLSQTSEPQSNSTVPARKPVIAKLSPAAVASLEDYEDHELHSDFVHAVHMLIPADAVGCLMGHRGEYMKEINAASECTLSIRDHKSFPTLEADRVLRIYGKPKGICLAQRIVVERIRNFRTHKGDSSYLDLGDKIVAPMEERFVTSAICQAVEVDDSDLDEYAIAQRGSLRWLINKDDVGKIMGQKGAIQRAIARDTDTSIHVVATEKMPPGSSERAVIITGQPTNIMRAREVIERKAGGRLETRATSLGKMGQYFVIPGHVAGFLIGPHGSRIKEIREDTGASIQIPAQHDLPLGYINRTLHIQGTKDQVEKARAAISRRLQTYMSSPESAIREDDIALQLLLPVRICSFLLDQRGRLIREITDKAGAHARFLPQVDEEHRICVLYGDMPKVFRAERLVLQFVAGDAIANKYAGAGGAPPRKRRRTTIPSEETDMFDSDEDSELGASHRHCKKRQQNDTQASGRIVVYAEPTKPLNGHRIQSNEWRKKTVSPGTNRSKRRR